MKKFIFAVSVLFLAVSCDKGADNVYALEETGGQSVVKGSENGLMWYIDDPDNANTKLNMMTYEKAVKTAVISNGPVLRTGGCRQLMN